ncbi:hypothetical protein D3C73_1018850 [compost metagenome]
MNGPKLLPVQFQTESNSYSDALFGVLSAKRWFHLPKPMLAGMTGACFRFSVHRQLLPDSPTAYNWMAEHVVACDLIGITASQWYGFSFSPTFPLYQRQAILDIISSIDRGTAAILWKDRFVIVNGYDAEQQLFYYLDGQSLDPQELPYTELGLNASPYFYCQIYENRFETETLRLIKESYMQAVFRAETPDIMLPEAEYACGLDAYDAILSALQSCSYHPEGAYATFFCYAAAKRNAAEYMQAAVAYWPASQDVANHYAQLSIIYEEILHSEQMNRLPRALSAPDGRFIDLVRAAQAAETAAVQSIRELLREPISNRFHDIGLR